MGFIWKPKKKNIYPSGENIYTNLVDCSVEEAEIYSIYDSSYDKQENWIADFKTRQDAFLFLIDKFKQKNREKTGKNQIFVNALDYYNFGEILSSFIRNSYIEDKITLKLLIIKTGLSRKNIVLALKIYNCFENDLEKLNNLSLNEVIKIVENKEGKI